MSIILSITCIVDIYSDWALFNLKHELIGRDFINIFNFNNDHPKMLWGGIQEKQLLFEKPIPLRIEHVVESALQTKKKYAFQSIKLSSSQISR